MKNNYLINGDYVLMECADTLNKKFYIAIFEKEHLELVKSLTKYHWRIYLSNTENKALYLTNSDGNINYNDNMRLHRKLYEKMHNVKLNRRTRLIAKNGNYLDMTKENLVVEDRNDTEVYYFKTSIPYNL